MFEAGGERQFDLVGVDAGCRVLGHVRKRAAADIAAEVSDLAAGLRV
jgi:hypothetical protein